MDSTSCKSEDASLLLAQFYKSLLSENNLDDTSLNLKIISNLMNAGLDVNHEFPDSFFVATEPNIFDEYDGISGGTTLDFAYFKKFSIDIFNTLLEHGADFTLKNYNGETVLHRLIETRRQEFKEESRAQLLLYINAVLSAHVKFHIITNPIDNNGFSHFHCACLVNHTEAVEFFLKNGVPIDQTTSTDSKFVGGCTGLHFAAASSNIETVKILLNNKADALIKNKRGMNSLENVIENRLELFENLLEDDENDKLLQNIENNEKMISLFLEKDYSPAMSFYAACSIKDASWVERLLEHASDINQPISFDSKKWPGWTGLHFAAHCNIDVVKLLLKKGGNIVAEDANGVTPLSICFNNNKFEFVCSLLSNDLTWNNTLLSDGKTKVLDVIKSMQTVHMLRSFLNDNLDNVNSIIPIDSTFWPGYTCLHVAVVILKPDWGNSNLTSTEIIRVFLNYGANVNRKNARGQTPIHLAYRVQKHVSILLEHLDSLALITDICDEDDLSYLHIACEYKNERLVERLLPASDVNLTYKGRFLEFNFANTGWTALHFATIRNNDRIVKLLLYHGANIECKDAFGMTPIHWIFGRGCADDIFFNYPNLQDVTTKFGLNYLHAAAFANNEAMVIKLISLGYNINTVMDCKEHHLVNDWRSDFLHFSGLSPLETALKNQCFKAFSGFLKSGVKLSTDGYKWTKILEQRNIFDAFSCRAYWSDDDLRKNIKREIGLTKLHVACYRGDVQRIKMLLNEGANVNARIHVHSKAFSGFTPLHMLIKFSDRYKYQNKGTMLAKIEMLMEKGADVTIANGKGDTPLHLSLELAERKEWTVEEAEKCATSLMSGHKDFSINPFNANGISHFHVACLVHNVEAVQGFLQHGVEVNQPINLFCEKYAKFTPLHLAFGFPLTKFLRNQSPSVVVNLLLKYGADVRAQDACGNTPLHVACSDARANVDILASLISLGADVKKENVRGETPFEILISSPDALDEQIRLFIKHGCRFSNSNSLTGKGYMGIFISAIAGQPKTITSRVMQYLNEIARDEMDRTPIHSVVSTFGTTNRFQSIYSEVIKAVLEKGIDVDDQDNLDKTALHCAAQFGNADAAKALVELGADINLIDKYGKSALSYAFERCVKMKDTAVSDVLFKCIRVRQIIGLDVSQLNQNLADEIGHNKWFGSQLVRWLLFYRGDTDSAIEISKNEIIGSTSITVYDFLSDYSAVVNYMFMPKKIRDEIDQFFKKFRFFINEDIYIILRSQYSKALARMLLVREVSFSLRSLLGFSFPGLCEDILVYLSNAEWKNVIKATID